MAGRCRLTATAAQRAELSALACSPNRGEADRARALLWSLAGEGGAVIGARLGVRADRVRKWRLAFARGGTAALRARPRTGRPGARGRRALAAAAALLDAPAPEGRVWTLPRLALAAGGGDRGGAALGRVSRLAAAAKGGFRWRRPRHTLKGRQDPDAVARSGLRLQLRRQQAAAGDIVLLFGDEAEVRTHPYLAHCWARRGADLRIEAPGRAERRTLLGVLDAATDALLVRTSASKRSADFIALLGDLDRRYGPAAAAGPGKPVVPVLDHGPIHTGRASRAALETRQSWLTVEWLPTYAPELNPIERRWRDLKRHYLANQTCRDVEDLDRRLHAAVRQRNLDRAHHVWPNLPEAA
jgi:transposase